jgi:hypothetical protein
MPPHPGLRPKAAFAAVASCTKILIKIKRAKHNLHERASQIVAQSN